MSHFEFRIALLEMLPGWYSGFILGIKSKGKPKVIGISRNFLKSFHSSQIIINQHFTFYIFHFIPYWHEHFSNRYAY